MSHYMGTEREVPQFPTGVCNGHYYLCVFCEQGEMCFAFVSYFPKAAGFDQCVQFADYDQCDNYIDQSKLLCCISEFTPLCTLVIPSHCMSGQLQNCFITDTAPIIIHHSGGLCKSWEPKIDMAFVE